MYRRIFNEKDLRDIRARGITPEEILRQIEIFKKGLSYVDLIRPCRIDDGINSLDQKDIIGLTAIYSKAQSAGRAMKFVPASGAATRMFKELSSANNQIEHKSGASLAEQVKNSDFICLLTFIENLSRFPFYNGLKSSLIRDGIDIKIAIREGDYGAILQHALGKKGLNLTGLPKALIPFHQYKGHSRTPIEEHLVEAAAYTVDGDGKARIHFTVSTEHEDAILAHIKSVRERYESPGIKFEIGLSNQKVSTDTIAVDKGNALFRDKDGGLIFRPGGHGALIENLRELNGDIIFIKNIDNITPDRLKESSNIYKKALAGHLVDLQDRIFSYLRMIEDTNPGENLLREIFDFMKSDLSISPPPETENIPIDRKIKYAFSRLNRPLRVCGMVRNQAEPGGGPFWIRHHDGSVSLQIIEKSQINPVSEDQMRILESSTHFNPVDLVCGVRDYRGVSFDLRRYIDPETCFISVKSYQGKEIKALELPGLWNGAMAFWNTVFIEVPLTTFNPVKTVLDLLRDEHQPEGY